MDVISTDQARIAEESGACAVMALERVPYDIRKAGGVARMADPALIQAICSKVSIPVMAKCRIGHFVEARVIEETGADFIDESEVLSMVDSKHHIAKSEFRLPFVCGCRNVAEALRRIEEGAVMLRTKGDAGTGDVCEAVRHMREIQHEINMLAHMSQSEISEYAASINVSSALVIRTVDAGRLPVVTFAAGGVATPADAALLMELGADGVFVGSVRVLNLNELTQ